MTIPLTILPGPGGIEHCLFMKAGALLRFDLNGGSVLRGPFVPRFNLVGRSAARWLPLVEKFLEIARTGKGPREQIASIGCSIKWKAEA